MTNKEIGEEFDIGYSGVSWIVSNAENLIEEDNGVKRDIKVLILHLRADSCYLLVSVIKP